eukprot:scaffold249790_cov22-Tisochrysis_lutea.AAC.1
MGKMDLGNSTVGVGARGRRLADRGSAGATAAKGGCAEASVGFGESMTADQDEVGEGRRGGETESGCEAAWAEERGAELVRRFEHAVGMLREGRQRRARKVTGWQGWMEQGFKGKSATEAAVVGLGAGGDAGASRQGSEARRRAADSAGTRRGPGSVRARGTHLSAAQHEMSTATSGPQGTESAAAQRAEERVRQIQAHFRARRRLRGVHARPRMRGWLALALMALGGAVCVYLQLGRTVAALAAVLAWLRLPSILGWLASVLITRFATHGYRISFGALHLSPWLERASPACGGGWRLKLRVCAEEFGFANPPGTAHRDFLAVRRVSALASVEPVVVLRALLDRRVAHEVQGTPGYRGWGVVEFEHVELAGATLTFELGEDGEFNINGLTRMLAEAEVRATLGRRRAPNVLLIHIGEVRGLRGLRLSSRPHVEVRARNVVLATAVGARLPAADGLPERFVFDETLALPLSDPSTVVQVRARAASAALAARAYTGRPRRATGLRGDWHEPRRPVDNHAQVPGRGPAPLQARRARRVPMDARG